MTHEDGALWLLFAVGLYAGWWYRGWAERRAERRSKPLWMGKLGHSLAAQFYQVDQGYRFTGTGVEITSEQTYEGGGHSFVVTVKRKKIVIIDQ